MKSHDFFQAVLVHGENSWYIWAEFPAKYSTFSALVSPPPTSLYSCYFFPASVRNIQFPPMHKHLKEKQVTDSWVKRCVAHEMLLIKQHINISWNSTTYSASIETVKTEPGRPMWVERSITLNWKQELGI